MEVGPGYKMTEVGVIPEDWEVKPLQEIGEALIGLTYRPEDVSSQGTLVLRSSNIQENALSFQDNVFVQCAIPERIMVQPGDVLICVRNGSRDLIGKSALLDERTEGMTFGAFMAVFRSSAGILVSYLFQSNILKRQISEHLGATINQITNKSLDSFLIPIPVLGLEQRAIARALGDVDALLEALERLIAKKRDLKQVAMQQLLTGQIRLPGFTGEWKEETLGELFDFSGGFSASRDQLSSEGHCYLHYGDIHGALKTTIDTAVDFTTIPKLDIDLARISRGSLLNDGDVVFVDASEDDDGTSKHVVVINKRNLPFISGLHTIVAKGRTEELTHEYRRYCFQTLDIRQQFLFYAVGTKVSGISKTNIPKLTLQVPTVSEQTAIAAILIDMDAEITALAQLLSKIRELKQGMMQELLTGRIRLVTPEEP